MVLGTGVSMDALMNTSGYNKLGNDISTVEKSSNEIVESKIGGKKSKKQEEKSTETVEEIKNENVESGMKKEDNPNPVASNNSSNSNNSGNNRENTSKNTTDNDYIPPVPVQTEWDKLGISEYDYYNSPGPNEGELAFRDAESKCDAVGTNISNKYGFVTHSGDVKSYSENYIGCWITIHLADGSWMFYREFLEREKRGEFKEQ